MLELREIPGWEGRYSASADGRIWSHRSKRWLRPYLTNGYARVDLLASSRTCKARVHRLVALAWIPNPDDLPEINHRDGVKSNNAPENLEWCNRNENIRHSLRIGIRVRKLGGGGCAGAKLSRSEAAIIRARCLRGDRKVDLAAEYLVTPETIRRIECGKAWRDVSPVIL